MSSEKGKHVGPVDLESDRGRQFVTGLVFAAIGKSILDRADKEPTEGPDDAKGSLFDSDNLSNVMGQLLRASDSKFPEFERRVQCSECGQRMNTDADDNKGGMTGVPASAPGRTTTPFFKCAVCEVYVCCVKCRGLGAFVSGTHTSTHAMAEIMNPMQPVSHADLAQDFDIDLQELGCQSLVAAQTLFNHI